MNGFLSFFLNAIKAIFLSPFYLLYYIFGFIVSLFNFLYGLVRSIFTGFKYGTNAENRYIVKLNEVKNEILNGGNNNE